MLHGQEFDCDQKLVAAQGLGLVPDHCMAPQPMKKRQVFLGGFPTQVQLIDDVPVLLTGMRRGELPRHLVCPRYLKV